MKSVGKQRFGRWLRQHRLDSRLWPAALRDWFDNRYSFGSGDRLTQKMLCHWLSSLGVGNFDSYIYRIKCIEAWADAESEADMRGAVDLELGNAIAVGQLLSIPTVSGEAVRVFHTNEIVSVIQGRLNPFPFSVERENTVMIQQLASYLQSVIEEDELSDFVGSQWSLKDAAPGGQLYELYMGTVERVRDDDLSAIARSIQEWREAKKIKPHGFTPNDLIKAMSNNEAPKASKT